MKMIKHWHKIAIAIAIGLLLVAFYFLPAVSTQNSYRAQVVQCYGGYGYDILFGDKVIIHQNFIPGTQGTTPFTTEEQALSTATFVVNKLNNGEGPVLTSEELKGLGLVK